VLARELLRNQRRGSTVGRARCFISTGASHPSGGALAGSPRTACIVPSRLGCVGSEGARVPLRIDCHISTIRAYSASTAARAASFGRAHVLRDVLQRLLTRASLVAVGHRAGGDRRVAGLAGAAGRNFPSGRLHPRACRGGAGSSGLGHHRNGGYARPRSSRFRPGCARPPTSRNPRIDRHPGPKARARRAVDRRVQRQTVDCGASSRSRAG
jgi:hypothetical protein